MSIKSVVFHREDCIRVSLRKVRKQGVAFLGTDLIYFIFQADLGNGILIHIITTDTDSHCKIHSYRTEHSCHSFKPVKRCTLLFPGASCCIVFSIVFRLHLLTFSPVLYNSGSSTYALSRPRQRSGSSLNYSITHQNRQVFEAPLKNSD